MDSCKLKDTLPHFCNLLRAAGCKGCNWEVNGVASEGHTALGAFR